MSARMAALTVIAATAVSSANYDGPWVLRAGRSFQQVGQFRIDADPTYRGAVRAFGPASTCKLATIDSGAIVRWGDLGLRIRIATLGAIPAGKTACMAPADLKVDNVRITSTRWRTSLGLRVDSSVRLLRRLYPYATYHQKGLSEGFPARSYWLVTTRTACLATCGATRFVTVPQLAAGVREGKVAFFSLRVGAQGE
jgi:hypothetical protein